jgi:hypothetical protein
MGNNLQRRARRSDTLLFNGPTTWATIYKDTLADWIHSFLVNQLHGQQSTETRSPIGYAPF